MLALIILGGDRAMEVIMNFHEVLKLKEAIGVKEAEVAISEGWKLLAIVPRAGVSHNQAPLIYVLGKSG